MYGIVCSHTGTNTCFRHALTNNFEKNLMQVRLSDNEQNSDGIPLDSAAPLAEVVPQVEFQPNFMN